VKKKGGSTGGRATPQIIGMVGGKGKGEQPKRVPCGAYRRRTIVGREKKKPAKKSRGREKIPLQERRKKKGNKFKKNTAKVVWGPGGWAVREN